MSPDVTMPARRRPGRHRLRRRLLGPARRALWRRVARSLAPDPAPSLGSRRPVFLLFTARSGSHYLLDSLGSVPGVAPGDEILNRSYLRGWRRRAVGDLALRFESREATLRYVARELHDLGAEVCVARFQPEQLARGGIDVSDLAGAFPAARFLILYRGNLAEQYVSGLVANRTRLWGHRGAGDIRSFQGRVQVRPEALRRYCVRVRGWYQELLRHPALAGRHEVVRYEDFCADLQGVFDSCILPFLGLPRTPVSSDYRKLNTRPLSEVVENYAEISDLLDGSESRQEFGALQAGGVSARAPGGARPVIS